MVADLPPTVAAAIVEFVTGPLLDRPYVVGKPLQRALNGHHSARRGAYRVVYRIDDRTRVVRIDLRLDVLGTKRSTAPFHDPSVAGGFRFATAMESQSNRSAREDLADAHGPVGGNRDRGTHGPRRWAVGQG